MPYVPPPGEGLELQYKDIHRKRVSLVHFFGFAFSCMQFPSTNISQLRKTADIIHFENGGNTDQA